MNVLAALKCVRNNTMIGLMKTDGTASHLFLCQINALPNEGKKLRLN